jgi:hypothetical protein
MPAPSLSYNHTSHTLTCVSSGVMADSATWQRNSVDISTSSSPPYQFQQNVAGDTFNSLLTITSDDVDDYIGSFSCTVSNAGISSPPQSLTITGTHIVMTRTCSNDKCSATGVSISGNNGVYQVRSSATLTCSSDLAVQTIRWLRNGREVSRNSGQQQLPLVIVVDTLDLANASYTCEVQAMLATGSGVVTETTIFRVNTSKCVYGYLSFTFSRVNRHTK